MFTEEQADLRVLGIDPGYAIVGYGVVDYIGNKFSVVEYGAVTTQAGVPFDRRLETIYDDITAIMLRTAPQALSMEKLSIITTPKP